MEASPGLRPQRGQNPRKAPSELYAGTQKRASLKVFCLEKRFSTGVLQEYLKCATPDCLVRGTDLFSCRLLIYKTTTANTTTAVQCECNKITPTFFVRSAQTVFFGVLRTSVVYVCREVQKVENHWFREIHVTTVKLKTFFRQATQSPAPWPPVGEPLLHVPVRLPLWAQQAELAAAHQARHRRCRRGRARSSALGRGFCH